MALLLLLFPSMLPLVVVVALLLPSYGLETESDRRTWPRMQKVVKRLQP
jgi:hypothetical protein